jgi:hypothetical protein
MAIAAYTQANFRACAYPTVWRLVGGACVGMSRASLLVIGLGVLTSEGPVPLVVLLRALLVGALLPALAGWLIERACVAEVEVRASELLVQGRGLRVEIPRTAVAAVVAWTLPLPGPGFALRLQSGRRFSYGLQAPDPTPLLAAFAGGAGIAAAHAATQHPVLVWAHAKHSDRGWRWYHWLAKFVLFALVPTAVWFYAHQHIAYGGLLGQYYLEGPGPYLKTFVISWSLAAIYLLLYASAWRAAAECVALTAAWLVPRRAAVARRAVEIVCRVAYYAGVPVVVLMPFLA